MTDNPMPQDNLLLTTDNLMLLENACPPRRSVFNIHVLMTVFVCVCVCGGVYCFHVVHPSEEVSCQKTYFCQSDCLSNLTIVYGLCTLNDTYNVTDKLFAIFQKREKQST